MPWQDWCPCSCPGAWGRAGGKRQLWEGHGALGVELEPSQLWSRGTEGRSSPGVPGEGRDPAGPLQDPPSGDEPELPWLLARQQPLSCSLPPPGHSLLHPSRSPGIFLLLSPPQSPAWRSGRPGKTRSRVQADPNQRTLLQPFPFHALRAGSPMHRPPPWAPSAARAVPGAVLGWPGSLPGAAAVG